MYETLTFETILERMLDRVDDRFDKREGSIIYDALAPAAAELLLVYFELDRLLQESFADTQSRDYLIRRAGERGVAPKSATYALRKGVFNIDVPIGARFSLGELNYVVEEKIEDGVFQLSCETPGEAGNTDTGTLLPIDYIEGLTVAQLTDVLVPGADEEETEAFRTRYFQSLEAQAFGGNIADYKTRVGFLAGVGGVKVIPTWNGPGTVKVIISDATHSAPSTELLTEVQDQVDPTGNSGSGVGIAPIGHKVTVAPVSLVSIRIAATLTLQEQWTWDDIKPYAEESLNKYFSDLAASWENLEHIVVRVSQIETRLLDLNGVLDISDTAINGSFRNITLEADQIPTRGELHVTTVN